jgi:capsular polysaccharide biosynthesis protein/RimJ/RimL family protein N-acetyltransferase
MISEPKKLVVEKIKGDTIGFRLVEPEDAAYIHQLRVDPLYGRYLSPAAPSLDAQRAWLEDYKAREFEGVEFYFLIERQDTRPCGTIRIYNVTTTEATWGSFILDAAKPSKAAFEALVLVHWIIFNLMGKESALFDVRKDNDRALALYRRFGAAEIGSDEGNIYFRQTSAEFAKQLSILNQSICPSVQRVDAFPPAKRTFLERASLRLRAMKDFVGRKYRKKVRRFERGLLFFVNGTLQARSCPSLVSKAVAIILNKIPLSLQWLPIAGYIVGSDPIAILAPSESYVSESPTQLGDIGRQAEGTFPAIEARIFKDVSATSLSSALILANRVHIPDYYVRHKNAVIVDGFNMLEQSSEGFALVVAYINARIETGIMLFASGATNYYHWLIEVLPLSFLAGSLPNRYADFPLVIPEQIANLQSFRDSLELFRGGREIVTIGTRRCRFDELVVIDPIVREPMNMRQGFWPSVEDYSYNPKLMLAYRNAICSRLGIQPNGHSDRIFLARGKMTRAYNENELLIIAARYGFRAVYAEQLLFRQQVEVLTAARFVVGPSGAAFANTLFCQEGTRLLSWVLPQYQGFCSFMNLARTVGSDMRYLFSEQNHTIVSTFGAHNAEYSIDPKAFETALIHMLSSAVY